MSGIGPAPNAARKQEENYEPRAVQRQLQKDCAGRAISARFAALWWGFQGGLGPCSTLVDELETVDGMAVHAYLHRKEGSVSNADYWYQRSGRSFQRPSLEGEWAALVEALLSGDQKE